MQPYTLTHAHVHHTHTCTHVRAHTHTASPLSLTGQWLTQQPKVSVSMTVLRYSVNCAPHCKGFLSLLPNNGTFDFSQRKRDINSSWKQIRLIVKAIYGIPPKQLNPEHTYCSSNTGSVFRHICSMFMYLSALWCTCSYFLYGLLLWISAVSLSLFNVFHLGPWCN